MLRRFGYVEQEPKVGRGMTLEVNGGPHPSFVCPDGVVVHPSTEFRRLQLAQPGLDRH
jgi:hypothetical protein